MPNAQHTKQLTLNGIDIYETEQPPYLVDLMKEREFFFCKKFTSEFLLRRKVCDKIKSAQNLLPQGYRFLIYEAFRTRQRQIELWDNIIAHLHKEHPEWDPAQYTFEANKFIANPHGFGSGHQAAAAVDITLCDDAGQEFLMGTNVQEFTAMTRTNSNTIKQEERNRRTILRNALETQGVINYPDEWWHFSYGDRLWAEVTGRNATFYAPVE